MPRLAPAALAASRSANPLSSHSFYPFGSLIWLVGRSSHAAAGAIGARGQQVGDPCVLSQCLTSGLNDV